MHCTKMHKTFSSVYWTTLTTEQALSVFEVKLDKKGRKKFCTIQRSVTSYTTTFFVISDSCKMKLHFSGTIKTFSV